MSDNRTEKGWKKKREYNRRWYYTQSPEKRLFNAARARAKKKGIEFSISVSDIQIPGECPILKIPIFVKGGRQTSNSPSIDRIDDSIGYVKDNVCVISYKANACKSNLTKEQIERLYKYVHRLGE